MVGPLQKIKKRKNASKAHPYQHLLNEEIAEVVRPLQSVAADDVSVNGNDEEINSEDEDEFDFEAYQVNEEKRLELASLMEKYDVYDEEQLRLAIRHEWKREKNLLFTAGDPLPSSDSASASPSRLTSRFVPPSLSNPLPKFGDNNPTKLAQDLPFHYEIPAPPT